MVGKDERLKITRCTSDELRQRHNGVVGGFRAELGQSRYNVGTQVGGREGRHLKKSGLRESTAGLINQNPHGKDCTVPAEGK